MKEKNSIFAGELSNHFYFREAGGFEAPLSALYYILKSMKNEKLSEISNRYMKYFQSGEINFKVTDSSKIMQKLREIFHDGNLDYIDGLTIEYDNWWCNIRPSNTESVIRMNIEAMDRNTLERKINEIINIIQTE